MKISIITGAYNQEKQLLKLYESLVKQKDLVHEWIVADDGSDDSTWSLLRGLASNSSVPVHAFSQTHQGMRLARNLNNGLRHATGELLFFVMGDSYLQDDTLKNLLNDYIPGSAGCGVRENVNNDGEMVSLDWRIKDNNRDTVLLKKDGYKYMTGNSMIVSRADMERLGGWSEGYEGYGQDDYDVFLRLERLGVPLYLYNNVRINHIYHGEGQPDEPKNVARFNILLKGEL